MLGQYRGRIIAVLAVAALADTAGLLWISSTSRRCSEMTHSFATRNDWMMRWRKFSNNGNHAAQQLPSSRLAAVVPFYHHCRHRQSPAAVSILAAPITTIFSTPTSALTMLPSTTATVKVQNLSTHEHSRDRRKDWTLHSMPQPQSIRPHYKIPP